jgi:hypothetical protein
MDVSPPFRNRIAGFFGQSRWLAFALKFSKGTS